ncbi:hypothetical protein BU16DRAFT_469767 [Lophium mytilinum]|uniref:Uncharacterized protein n=1 Tax=Lophium mytilinum TaxID=390894 RepID=A0A6A6QGB7_9PEZI|nr:hypothetical protein BU16DRAFT_469767 [Lophium mytilinum]
MAPTKAYFEMPNFDYAPGTIKIGEIIADLKSPGSAIYEPLNPAPPILESYQENWEAEKSRTLGGSLGIWAQFLAMILGISGDISGHFGKDDSDVLKFDKLETAFVKSDWNLAEYVRASILQPTVKQYFEANPKKTPYMITGFKVARGAENLRKKYREVGADASVAINGTMVGIPVSGGPQVGFSNSKFDSVGFAGSSDFIFAYRVRKIKINWKTMDVDSEDYMSGAAYHEGERTESNLDEDITPAEIESAELDEADFGIAMDADSIPLDWTMATVRDEMDDSDCLVVKIET